jgi:hypothetical protein
MSCYCSREDVDASTDYDLPIAPGDDVWAIVGSRSFDSVPGSIKEKAQRVVEQFDERSLSHPDVIISGGADGADAVAEAVAVQLGVPMIVFSVGEPSSNTQFRRQMADEAWVVETVTTYPGDDDDPRSGKGAYTLRNCMMAAVLGQHDGSAFAIWNGDSPGTRHMLDSCDSHGADTEIWRF